MTSVPAVTNEERKPLVYVAGPITGDPWGCVRQGTDAFAWLREAGCVPFLPQLSVLHEIVAPMSHADWLAYDFEVLRHCHALVRLPGASKGARAEVAHARALGIEVFVAAWVEDGIAINRAGRPLADDVAEWARRWRP